MLIHQKWLLYQILVGKTVKNVQIDPQTMEIWKKKLNFVSEWVCDILSNYREAELLIWMTSSIFNCPCPLLPGPNTVTNTYSLPQITDNYPISGLMRSNNPLYASNLSSLSRDRDIIQNVNKNSSFLYNKMVLPHRFLDLFCPIGLIWNFIG